MKKKIIEWLANPTTTKKNKVKKTEPIEYTYLLTIIDVFSKYLWVFPLQTHNGTEIAIALHELFSQPYIGREYSPYKPKLLLSDLGTELKNPHTNFISKHHYVFQIYAFTSETIRYH